MAESDVSHTIRFKHALGQLGQVINSLQRSSRLFRSWRHPQNHGRNAYGLTRRNGSRVPVCFQPSIEGVGQRIFAPHLFNVEVKTFFLEPVVQHHHFLSHGLLELVPGNLNVLHISRCDAAERVGNLLHR